MKIRYIVPVIALVLLAAGCNSTKKDTTESTNLSQATMNNTGESTDAHAHDAEHGAKLAGSRIDLQNINNLKPGVLTLAFKLYGLDAHEFKPQDLNTEHEKLMHLILVRDDITGFQHLHPEYKDGRWTVLANIPSQGLYQMYADISPKEESPITLRVPITIGGATQQAQAPSISSGGSVEVNGIQATLQNTTSFKTQENTKLIFTLTQNNKPITQIDPYLGAFGHVVVLRHGDPDDYLHGHPVTETKPINGQVEFESEFPTKGIYTIFGQFNIGGQVKIFPITINVTSEGQPSADEIKAMPDAHSGH